MADLDQRRHRFHVAIENWQHDLNIGSVVRTANAFLAAEVHIVGRRRWNRRGAMVTDRYQHITHHDSVGGVRRTGLTQAELPLYGVDNLPGAEPLESTALPESCVLVFGQEGPGLTDGDAARRAGVRCRSPSSGRPVDQCRCRGSHRDARLDPAACGVRSR